MWQPTSNDPRPEPRTRVLLAEDDADLRQTWARVLDEEGYAVTEASDGAALLLELSSWVLEPQSAPPTDVIVSDVRMPGIDGLSLLEGLVANGWRGPLVVVSGHVDPPLRARVAALPNARLLPKPVAPGVLRATLREVTASG